MNCRRFVAIVLGIGFLGGLQSCAQWFDVGVDCGPVKTECCPCPSESDCPDGLGEVPEKCFHPADGGVD